MKNKDIYIYILPDIYIYIYIYIQKRSFNVQESWHSINTLPTMVQGQTFLIITDHNMSRPYNENYCHA